MKYKLIKEYPGSPKLNFIVKFKEELPYVSPAESEASCKCNLSLHECQNYPEFWELIKEPEFEILELIQDFKCQPYNTNIWKLQSDNKYTLVPLLGRGTFTLMQLLVNSSAKIHKIKRLSDEEIFIVGDKTNNGIIERFEKSGDMIRVYFKDKGNYHVNLNTIEHSKVLFTTEDGVDIFEGDTVYWVEKDKLEISEFYSKPLREPWFENLYLLKENHYYLRFSSKEKAQEYIDNNKPKYSKQEIIDTLDDLERINPKVLSTIFEYIRHKLKI